MAEPGGTPSSGDSGAGPLDYPTNRMIGVVAPDVFPTLVPALIEAGFAPIGILAGEAGLRRLRQTGGGSGLDGLLRRLQMSMGGDLDFVTQAQESLAQGLALVDVEAEGDEAKQRARAVLEQHGAQRIVYFSPWTIELLA